MQGPGHEKTDGTYTYFAPSPTRPSGDVHTSHQHPGCGTDGNYGSRACWAAGGGEGVPTTIPDYVPHTMVRAASRVAKRSNQQLRHAARFD
jgi:hypothetical protein